MELYDGRTEPQYSDAECKEHDAIHQRCAFLAQSDKDRYISECCLFIHSERTARFAYLKILTWKSIISTYFCFSCNVVAAIIQRVDLLSLIIPSMASKMVCISSKHVLMYRQFPMKNVFIEQKTTTNFSTAMVSIKSPQMNPEYVFWSNGNL